MIETGQDDMLLDHEYDGIREYDNPLPSWWSWLWIGSMVFSVAYVFWYHIGVGPSVHDKYQAEVTAYVSRMLDQLGEIQGDNATILEYMDKSEWMAAAGGMFVGNCSQCHRTDGGGNIGPNLTDDYFKNVKQPEDIYTVITKGVNGTGMNAWEDRLSDAERILLSAYVATLRGNVPADGKAPEGAEIPAWSTFETAAPSAEEPS